MSDLQRVPAHEFHAAQGARFVGFGGWEMPVQYTSIIEEHKAVRTAAGLFDVSHMGEFFVRGEEAEAFLDNLVTNKIAGAPDGRAIYSPMCAEDGGVVDDLIVYRVSQDAFLVCVNASNIEKDFAWFQQQVGDFNCTVENQSAAWALFAIQGPKAEALLNPLASVELTQLKRFWHVPGEVAGVTGCRIARTGYTGEDGFEVYVPADQALRFAEAIWAALQPQGLALVGLGARDSLRLEAGLPLYGHEINAAVGPLEGSLDWTVKFKKDQFVGKAALEAQKAKGVPRLIVHFTLEGRRIAREGTPVLQGEVQVGQVVSGTMSPMLNQPIGAALVDAPALEGEPLFVDLRGNKVMLERKQPPLHKS